MTKLEKRLAEITRAGMLPDVVESPPGASTFDKMIIVWIARAGKPFLYQVHFWDSGAEKIVGTFN